MDYNRLYTVCIQHELLRSNFDQVREEVAMVVVEMAVEESEEVKAKEVRVVVEKAAVAMVEQKEDSAIHLNVCDHDRQNRHPQEIPVQTKRTHLPFEPYTKCTYLMCSQYHREAEYVLLNTN